MTYRGACRGMPRAALSLCLLFLLAARTITVENSTDSHSLMPGLPPPSTSELDPGKTTTTCDDQSYLSLWQQTANKFTKQVKRYADGLNFGVMSLKIQAAYATQNAQGTESAGASSLQDETCTKTCTPLQKRHMLDASRSTKEMFTVWSSSHESWSKAPIYVEGFPSLYALVHVAFRDRLDSMKRDVQKIERQCKWKREKSLAIIFKARESLESYQHEVEEYYRRCFERVQTEIDRLDEYVLTNCDCNMYKEAS